MFSTTSPAGWFFSGPKFVTDSTSSSVNVPSACQTRTAKSAWAGGVTSFARILPTDSPGGGLFGESMIFS